MKRLLKQMDGRIYLIVDGHPVHKSGAATRFAATHSARGCGSFGCRATARN
jgi:hypothetical protein